MSDFKIEIRKLIQQRLNGLEFPTFARMNLEIYQRYGKPGYDLRQYERDMREYLVRAERQRKAELAAAAGRNGHR